MDTGDENVKVYNNFLGDEKPAIEIRHSMLSNSKRGSQGLNSSMFSTRTNKYPLANQHKRMNSYNQSVQKGSLYLPQKQTSENINPAHMNHSMRTSQYGSNYFSGGSPFTSI
mgnify:CR=1 FL=1